MKYEPCRLIHLPLKERGSPISTDLIFLDEGNKLYVLFNFSGYLVRINKVETTDIESFRLMMNTLIKVSQERRFDFILYADSLSDEVLNMFLLYGFSFKPCDPYNHYLFLSPLDNQG